MSATALTGSGNNVPMPSTTGATPPGIAPTLSFGTGSFTGTWSSNAPTAWQGTFAGTGDYPCCGNAGTTSWSFTGLSGGFLPTGTFFRLGDVDNGETMTLTAYNQANQIITGAWLNVPSFVSSPTPSDIQLANLPGWAFASGVYTFTGRSGVNGNTLLTITLPSNTDIFRLVVGQPDSNAGFSLAAPDAVPEPGTYAMMGGALAALALYKRRRNA
jgi:hypothetical protein